jgi:acetyl esterase/lipase
LAAKGGAPLEQLSVEEARQEAARGQAVDVVKLPADIEDHTISGGPSGTILIRIVRPKGRMDPLPVVMYFHGGGWVLNDRESFDRLLREIANGAGAAVVFVEYSRSPEARYPVAIEEAYASTKWIVENGQSMNTDPSRLAVAGDSSGANMATVVALLAKQRGGPKIHFQVLFSPTTDANFDTPSYKEFAGRSLPDSRGDEMVLESLRAGCIRPRTAHSSTASSFGGAIKGIAASTHYYRRV